MTYNIKVNAGYAMARKLPLWSQVELVSTTALKSWPMGGWTRIYCLNCMLCEGSKNTGRMKKNKKVRKKPSRTQVMSGNFKR